MSKYTFDIASVANNLIEEIDETVKMNKFVRNALDILHLKAELANVSTNNYDISSKKYVIQTFLYINFTIFYSISYIILHI